MNPTFKKEEIREVKTNGKILNNYEIITWSQEELVVNIHVDSVRHDLRQAPHCACEHKRGSGQPRSVAREDCALGPDNKKNC